MTSRLLSFINQSRTIFSADQIDNTVFLIGHSIHIIRLKSLNRKKNYIHKMINIILSPIFSILALLRNIQKRFMLGKSPLNYILFFYKDSSALNFQQICKELVQLHTYYIATRLHSGIKSEKSAIQGSCTLCL